MLSAGRFSLGLYRGSGVGFGSNVCTSFLLSYTENQACRVIQDNPGISRNVNQGSVQEIETALVIASVTLFQHRALVKSGLRTEARTHTEDELWQLQAGGEDRRCNAQTWGLEEAPGVLGPGLAVWGC